MNPNAARATLTRQTTPLRTAFAPPSPADLFGLNAGPLTGINLPIAGIILAGVITVSGMSFHHRRREMGHETAHVALERGQPRPPLGPDRDDDVRKPKSLAPNTTSAAASGASLSEPAAG